MKTYENILIVRTDRIGDVILTTPAILALREANLGAKISILVTPQTLDIVDGNPCLDEIFIDDRKGIHRGFWGFLKLVCMLRKKKFDLAVVLHTKKRTNLLCFLSGIPSRIGYKNNKFGFLLTKGIPDQRPEGLKHEAEYCLDVLRHIGINVQLDTLKLDMPLKEEANAWVENIFSDNFISSSEKVIAVHPGASCISKRWPAQRFAEVINSLGAPPFKVILVGAPDNQQIAQQVLSGIKIPIIDLTGQTSVAQLASLFKRCRLLISNDSGPVHLAVAVGTPVISIFGRNQKGLSPTRWRPLGKKDIALHKEVGCEICLAHDCRLDFKCLQAVSVSEVVAAAKSLLSL
ncbi:MAG TPA: glycosyltransferase family 9 protein [Candidatus Omnitrophota bacterium]|nr:glycosyltransferase family 9 protein [Candidatus Omnitrophota bacterium]HPD84987.1 glycosyltransferase family 9 protein [Candidatus Omnitrophota bacterium]HRZ03845.1 glycosyltransferase family 9 protein [Candidatus Omnitrophota bacterium]